MRLNDQIHGTNGTPRIPGNPDDELGQIQERIKDRDRQIEENLQRMVEKRKDWEAENTRLSRRVLFIVLGLVAAGMVVNWYWS